MCFNFFRYNSKPFFLLAGKRNRGENRKSNIRKETVCTLYIVCVEEMISIWEENGLLRNGTNKRAEKQRRGLGEKKAIRLLLLFVSLCISNFVPIYFV